MFKDNLKLTSPHTKGEHVRQAQFQLKHNRYGIDFMPGEKVDGVYGPATAAAVHKAKWLLGYGKSKVNGTFGPRLYGYLIDKKQKGHKLRSPWMVRVGKKRQKEANNIGLRALHTAQTQIGIKESPYGSNRVKYTAWYGYVGPWCAMFVSWCMAQNGGKFRYAYVPAAVEDARQGSNGLRITHTPGPGTVVAYDWDGGVADHMGIFERWIVHGQSFYAIEGNTSGANNSNGGEVMRRERYLFNVQAFIEVTR